MHKKHVSAHAWSNCIIWALRQWLAHGGYVIVRKSRYGLFPHMLWTDSLGNEPLSYCPKYPRPRIFPPLIFRGYVKVGDR